MCSSLRFLILSFGLFLITSIKGYSQIADSVHRVLFIGNSITYAGSYITDIETYFIVHYPSRKIEFINLGLPSETVSGLSEPGHAGGRFPRPDLHERLARILAQTKPDLVFACYGMNDGIYMPFDEERFNKFKDGINWMHDMVIKAGARLIHLTPPVFDELRGGSTGYASVLDRYSDWLLSQRKKSGWEVADLHYPMKKYLEAHRKVDERFGIDGFALAQDGVHPGETGHWIMAKQILLYLGEKDIAKAPNLNAILMTNLNGMKIYDLVAQRQMIMKDAWLTAIGHKRPDMNVGLPLTDARGKADSIEKRIRNLIN